MTIYQKKQGDKKITELQADLVLAHQVIKQQQQQITQLQAQINNTKNQFFEQQSTLSHKDISVTTETNSNQNTVAVKSQHQRGKMMLKRKQQSERLSTLQFASIVTGIVLIITLTGLALIRRQNSSPAKPVTTSSVNLNQTTNTLPPPPVLPSLPVAPSAPIVLPEVGKENLELAFNLKTAPNFHKSQKLQAIVNDVVALAADKKFPRKPLSITLIDTKSGTYAAYQQKELRYPASVVKIFWMVYLYALINKGFINEADFTPYLNEMIKNSDNNSASYIFDAITDTKSGQSLEGKEYETWLNKRIKLNKYFQNAGYENININQKTFPINYLKIYKPQGSDLRMRGNPEKPIRNKITTLHAARLLYEIYDGQAVSPIDSQKMTKLLTIDSQTRILKKDDQNPNEFNPVRGFLSQSLPSHVYFGGKAGWTSGSRQDAAYIATADGKAAYILVIFAEDHTYAYDWKIFPEMSRLVFDRMTNPK